MWAKGGKSKVIWSDQGLKTCLCSVSIRQIGTCTCSTLRLVTASVALPHVGAKLLLLLSAVLAVVTGKLAAQLYGGDSAVFFWLACIVTVLEGILLFGVEDRLSSFFRLSRKMNDDN